VKQFILNLINASARSSKPVLQLAFALILLCNDLLEDFLFKIVGCFISYQFSAMFFVFIAGMSMNAGQFFTSLFLLMDAAIIYYIKGDPVGFWNNKIRQPPT
jgi:hypothetical protein